MARINARFAKSASAGTKCKCKRGENGVKKRCQF